MHCQNLRTGEGAGGGEGEPVSPTPKSVVLFSSPCSVKRFPGHFFYEAENISFLFFYIA